MKAGWWDSVLALRDLAEATPIISDNGLPLLTENNFQTLNPSLFYLGPLPFLLFWLPPPPPLPRLLIFRLSVGPPPLPIIWNWRVVEQYEEMKYKITPDLK